MTESVLDGKRILIVDDEPDVLDTLEDVISDRCPHCAIHKATTYEEAVRIIEDGRCDVVILDIMGVSGFELLERAVKRDLPVAMLTAHALSPEALKKSFDMGARAYLPKEMMADIVSLLQDVLTQERLPGWTRLMERLKGFFDAKFDSEWEKKTGLDWREWGKL
jgi:DNA-binding response OmpR family regulator